jgi:hypothetical protein
VACAVLSGDSSWLPALVGLEAFEEGGLEICPPACHCAAEDAEVMLLVDKAEAGLFEGTKPVAVESLANECVGGAGWLPLVC